MLVQFGNTELDSKNSSDCQIWQSSEFFSSNYFQIGQHVVLLHIGIVHSGFDCPVVVLANIQGPVVRKPINATQSTI